MFAVVGGMLCKSDKPSNYYCYYLPQYIILASIMHSGNRAGIQLATGMEKKSDAARAWIKEAGRMNHLKHTVP